MDTINISGKFNENYIISSLLEAECAFMFTGKTKHIKVAFHKGQWFFIKQTDKDQERLEINDNAEIETSNSLLKGFALEKFKNLDTNGCPSCIRHTIAYRTSQILSLWLGEKIEEIVVVKDGRNSSFDEYGNFDLS